MPLSRPPEVGDLGAVALPVLLFWGAGQPHVTGTLRIEMDGGPETAITVVDGRALLDREARQSAIAAFQRPSGRYSFDRALPRAGAGEAVPMSTLVIDGLRSLIRTFDLDDITAALGPLCDRTPSSGRPLPARPAAWRPPWRRASSSTASTGSRSLRNVLAQAGALRRTTLQLAFLLYLVGLLELREAEEQAEESLSETLAKRARQMATANHFEALGVHWSATDDEGIEARYRALCELRAPHGAASRAAPEVSASMLDRAKAAYEVLRVEASRKAHRRQAYPDLDYATLRDFLDKKARALAMRTNQRPRKQVEKTLRDLEQPGRPGPGPKKR